jgi:hypothetical protein
LGISSIDEHLEGKPTVILPLPARQHFTLNASNPHAKMLRILIVCLALASTCAGSVLTIADDESRFPITASVFERLHVRINIC